MGFVLGVDIFCKFCYCQYKHVRYRVLAAGVRDNVFFVYRVPGGGEGVALTLSLAWGA